MIATAARLALAAALLATSAAAALAQNYPTRSVKVIVPNTPGSGVDIVGRAVSQRLQERMGQAFVVENRAGAGTTTGIAAAAASAPDGYTILFATAAMTTTPVTMAKLPYEVSRDLAGVMPLVNTPLAMITPAGRYRDVKDFVAKAKAAPGKLDYASVGFGAAAHFASEQLAMAAGFKAQMVAFRGTTEAVTEVLAGRMEFFMTPVTSVQELVRDKKVDALVVTSRRRSAELPDVPTAEEAGFKDSQFDFWVGLLVPRATPRAIVDVLHARSLEIMQDKGFREQMAKIGGEVMDPQSPADFDKFIAGEIERNRAIAKAAGIEAK
jgi:tripartite-type tricarboxylate transporter receptor subunit TctC